MGVVIGRRGLRVEREVLVRVGRTCLQQRLDRSFVLLGHPVRLDDLAQAVGHLMRLLLMKPNMPSGQRKTEFY